MTLLENSVWRALEKIPKGKVTTYQEIAKYLGQPKAARAIGNACKRNPKAPKVPCHRVVKSDGGVGGYAKGSRIKIKLLESEGMVIINNKIVDFKKKLYYY